MSLFRRKDEPGAAATGIAATDGALAGARRASRAGSWGAAAATGAAKEGAATGEYAGTDCPLMLAMAASEVRRKAMCDSAIERW